ncbi:MAG: hypothetical protein AAFX99_05935 [Myxococcota bacterium]
MGRLKRIVCYAVNGSGLGHVTRLMSIARWLRRYAAVLEGTPPEVLFLTSSEATQVLLQGGFASFKLPSKTVVRQTGMDMLEYRRLARHFVWHVLGTFTPQLLIVDTFPAGSFDELLQVLDGPFRKGFIHRQVKPQYAQRPTFQAALSLYDSIAIPHSPLEQPHPSSAGAGPVVAPSPPHSVWCGEVFQFERAELGDRAEARQQLGVAPDQVLVYLSAGGGGDPTSEAALGHLITALSERPDRHLLVGAGPLYRGRRFGGPRLTWFTEPRVFPYLAASDAAFSAGGYNTFHELMHLGVPTVFFAQDKVADDQAQRIREAAAAGACCWLQTPLTDHSAIRLALDDVLDRSTSIREAAMARGPTNGAARCAQVLLAGLYTHEQLAWASHTVTPDLASAFERHGADGLKTMGHWLPELLPALQVNTLDAHPSFRALLNALPEATAIEVRQALHTSPQADALARCSALLSDLVSIDMPQGLSTLTALVVNATKKHPIRQEPSDDWLTWLQALLAWRS